MSGWQNITDISCSCESAAYSNILAGGIENIGCDFGMHTIAMGFEQKPCINILGVDKNGKVYYEGNNPFNDMSVISQWSNIKSVAAGDIFCVGLKDNGTVVLAGNNEYENIDVSGWTDIKVY